MLQKSISSSSLQKNHYSVNPYCQLTPKESEVSNWLVEGLRANDIAIKMGIRVRTVRYHIENIKDKLGCKTLISLGYSLAHLRNNSSSDPQKKLF